MTFRWPRRWSRRRQPCGRTFGILLLCSTIILFIYTLFSRLTAPAVDEVSSQTSPARPLSPLIPQQAKFWRELYTIILHNDPKCEYPPEVVVPHKTDVGFDPSHNHPRPDILWIRPLDVKRMHDAHANFLGELHNNPPEPIYEPFTKGIVMTAGLNQLPILVISLNMIRRTDCDLPVEVFLASSSDYDQQVCEVIFPELKARCLVFSDIVLASKTGVALEGYQFKIMALLFSSFEEVLILDSDAFPTRNPASLFDATPFSENGMVLWPDFWYPSESPYFFELAQLGTPPPLNARPAVESGEMMFSKSKHNLTLLLAAYYNYHGPQYFYPLLSQGAPGQGDKDTFPWAATVIHSNTSFYLVHEPVFALGHTDSSGIFIGSAMAQHDPISDFQRFHQPQTPLLGSQSDPDSPFGKPNAHPQTNTSLPNKNPPAPPLFIHANFPKFDPSTIFTHFPSPPSKVRITYDSNNTAVRAWLPADRAIAYFGYDVERAFWAEIQYVACQWGGMFKAWTEGKGAGERGKGKGAGGGEDEEDETGWVCEGVKSYRSEVEW